MPREQNEEADRQSNLGADMAEGMADKLTPYEAWRLTPSATGASSGRLTLTSR